MAISHKLIAIAAGVVVFGAVSASAATLGGLETDDLGANSNTVKAQVTGGVGVSWTTQYLAAAGGYVVKGLTLTPASGTIDPTASVSVTLKGTGGVALGEYTSTDGGQNWTGPDVPARDVVGASVVVDGGTSTAGDTTLD